MKRFKFFWHIFKSFLNLQAKSVKQTKPSPGATGGDKSLNRKQRRQMERGAEPASQNGVGGDVAMDASPSPQKESRKRQQAPPPESATPSAKQARQEQPVATSSKPTLPQLTGAPIDSATKNERTVFVSNLDFGLPPDRFA